MPPRPQQALLVAGAPELHELARRALTAGGFRIVAVADGRQARAACDEAQPDLVVLDLHPQGVDGLELCRQLRERSSVPIMLLATADEQAAILTAYELGADDCLSPPFHTEELLVRVRALLRRARLRDAAHQPALIRSGTLTVDLYSQQVTRNGQPVRLNPKQWGIMEALLRSGGRVLTHRMLLKRVWGDAYGEERNYLHSYIYELRRKLEDDPSEPRYLVAEPGIGYRFVIEEAEQAAPAPTAPMAPTPALARPPLLQPPEPARPPEVTSFVGREAELRYFAEKLAGTGLAVICGMPGVGKTALASILASQSSPPERIFWHAFHKGQGIEVVIWCMAGFLAQHGQLELWQIVQRGQHSAHQIPPPQVLLDYLVQMLGRQRYLLCFDDFQFVDDDPLLGYFMQRLRGAMQAGAIELIVTTHRLPAFLQSGEVEPLHGLSVDDTSRLLAQRGLVVSKELAAALHTRTAGNAQLLLLASAILHRTPDETQLLARLPRLIDIERFLMTRVDERLTPAERAVMGAVAVLLEYPASADVIEEVLGQGSARQPLSDLSKRSLLIVVDGESGPRYYQHGMVQAFYYDRLGLRERRAMHQRAATHYAQHDALQAARHFYAAGEYAGAAQLVTQEARAIINRGEAALLCQVLAGFTAGQLERPLWVAVLIARAESAALAGANQQAQQNYQEALAQLAQLPDSPQVSEQRARAYRGIGEALQHEAPREALDWLRRSLGEVAGSGAPEEAALHIKAGTVHITLGEHDAALAAVERGLALLPAEPGSLHISALINLGLIACAMGDLERGNALTQQALSMSQQIQDYWSMITAWLNIAVETEIAGDWTGAEITYHQALALAERLGSRKQQFVLELNLGILNLNRGNLEEARARLLRCVTMARESNESYCLATGLASLAELQLQLGELEACVEALDESERLAREIEAREHLAEIYRVRARLQLTRDKLPLARESAEQALQIAQDLESEIGQGVGLRVLAQVLLASGAPDEARQVLEQSQALLADRDPYEAARTSVQLGCLLYFGRDPARGRALLSQARATFQALGAVRDLLAIDRILSS